MTAPTVTTPRTTPPPAPPPEPPRHALGRVLFGALLIVLGTAWLLDAAGLYELRWQSALSVALMAVGLSLLVTARRGYHGGLVALGLVLAPAVIIASLIPAVNPFSGAGERVYTPTSLAAVETQYELGAGPLNLDLRDIAIPPGEQLAVEASVGMGELIVRVPEGVALDVVATSGAGDVMILDREWNGVGVNVDETFPGSETAGRLLLELSIGLGRMEVTR